MKETKLSDAIDRLAVRKAEAFIDAIKVAIETALKGKMHAKVARTSEWVGIDVKHVLLAYAKYLETSEYKKPEPTSNLINILRANILDELLDGMPRVRELALMAEANETDAETMKFFDNRHDARVAAGNQPLGGGEA